MTLTAPVMELVGSVAALLTTSAFLPQTLKVIREKDTRAISLGMYVVFVTGIVLWLVYGLALGSWPMIIANTITFALAATILTLKVRYG